VAVGAAWALCRGGILKSKGGLADRPAVREHEIHKSLQETTNSSKARPHELVGAHKKKLGG